MRNTIVVILLVALVFSCEKKSKLHNYMINKWQTTYIKVEMLTYTNSDSTSINEEFFTATNAIVPQSEYYEDGTYKSWYLNPNGGVIGEINGNWTADENNLYLEYEFANNPINITYKVTKTGEGFNAHSINDWDFDGVKDDTLYMKVKRLKK